ncbi:hypothetical protein SRABI70_04842 [Pseudomonas sp. Bi70]|nr:hypothetical protein SRABI70_04842 [Pseudomonas sp. Bi70]
MAAVGLEHHRATGGQGGGGVTTGGGEGQREVAGAEHGNRAEADAVLAQIRARQRLAIRQGTVDARAIEVATAQHFGEQAHLAAGTAALTLDTGGRQGGFAAHGGDELVTQGVQLVSDGVEELGALGGGLAAVSRVGSRGCFGGGVDFLRRGLDEIVGQGFASGGVMALVNDGAGCAERAADDVVADGSGHC